MKFELSRLDTVSQENASMKKIRKNEVIEVTIESLAFGGLGVAHYDGFTLFIKRALPYQKVAARLTRIKKNYAEAKVVDVLEHSTAEVEPKCSHFGVCGGCLFQNLDYREQLTQKQNQIRETLEHIGGFADVEILPIIPSHSLFHYRNKMEFSFSDRRWLTKEEIESTEPLDKDFALGLHIPGVYDKVLDINGCFLLSERSNQVVKLIRDYAINSELKPYTTKDHTGFWRFLVIRESKKLDQMMVNIVTADAENGDKVIKKLAYFLVEQFPFITTVVHNINRKKAQIAFGDEERILIGPGYIEEMLGTKKYRISANSFFQTNTLQAERLYQLVAEWGDFRESDIVYDLYSGIGSIAIFIADLVERVLGMEVVPEAVYDASINSKLNNIDNCEFILGDLKEIIKNPALFMRKYRQPDVVIIDPPRSGMHPKLPVKILQLKPRKIIYVSCNPSTLARDLKMICEGPYRISKVQPIDMFPHTAHCETVVLLEQS